MTISDVNLEGARALILVTAIFGLVWNENT